MYSPYTIFIPGKIDCTVHIGAVSQKLDQTFENPFFNDDQFVPNDNIHVSKIRVALNGLGINGAWNISIYPDINRSIDIPSPVYSKTR